MALARSQEELDLGDAARGDLHPSVSPRLNDVVHWSTGVQAQLGRAGRGAGARASAVLGAQEVLEVEVQHRGLPCVPGQGLRGERQGHP